MASRPEGCFSVPFDIVHARLLLFFDKVAISLPEL